MKTRTSNTAHIDEWKLESVLASLLELSDNQGRLLCPPFRVLESKEEFPLYHEQIKNPIDLKTIAERIRNGAYFSWISFDADIKLLVRNAKQFNEPGSMIFKDAGKILSHFNKMYDDAIQPNYKLSQMEIEHNHDVVTSLLESHSSEPDDLSEDSEEDEDSETDKDSKWILYWKIRNFDVIDGFPLCTHFLELPSKKCYPDYYEEIEKPVSLYMINKMLKRNEIKSLVELVDYLQQMFKNARFYNVEESEIYVAANTLEQITIDTANELDPNINAQISENQTEEFDGERPTTSRRERSSSLRKPRRVGRRMKKRTRKMSENSSEPSIEDEISLQIKAEEIAEFSQSRSESIDFKDDDEDSMPIAPLAPPKRRIGRPRRGDVAERSETSERIKPGRKSLEELREKFSETLLSVWKIAKDLKMGSRSLCDAFMKLPSIHDYPDYYTTIKNPIDLTMIRKKIENCEYQDSEEALADFLLMCENARKYNRPNSQIALDASLIESAVKSTMKSVTNDRTIYYPYRKSDKNWTENAACSSRALGKPRKPKMPKLESADSGVSSPPVFMMTAQMPCGPPGMVPYYQPGAPPGSLPFFVPPNTQAPDSLTYQHPGAITLPPGVPPPTIIYVEPREGSTQAGRRRRPPCSEEDQMINILESITSFTDSDGRVLSDIFVKLPTRAEYPEYYEVIRRPMDLNRVRSKLHTRKYDSMKSFIADMNLVFDNACRFNESESYIYRDALILQKELLRLRNELIYEEPEIPSVQAEVRGLLKALLQSVKSYKDGKGKCLVDWLADVPNLLKKVNIKSDEFPFTLEEIEKNLENGRYLRLDRFQEDLFALLAKAREHTKANTEGFKIYNVSIELQQFFINKRDELYKNSLKSPAMLYNMSLLNGEIEELEKRRRQRIRQKSVNDGDDVTSEKVDEKMSEGVEREEETRRSAEKSVSRDSYEILDVHREEVLENKKSIIGSSGDAASDAGIVYYQQMEHCGKYFQLGNGVLLFRDGKPHCEVMRIDKMWKNAEGDKMFSGCVFVRPAELIYEPSNMFHKREVVAVEQLDVTESFKNVQAKCAILSAKQFETCRPTEIPECDVFVVNYKVPGNVDEISALNPKNCSLLTSINTEERCLPEDGELNFRYARPYRKLKESYSQDSSWLASQPKLNAKSKSGYILFSAEVRKRIMNENPEAGFGEVSKIVGIEWKKLSAESKRQYEVRAQYIAEERAKAEPSTPSCKPGQVCVYACRWERCDFHFNSQEGLYEHVRTSHAVNIAQEFTAQRPGHKLDPLSESKMDTQYVCLWNGCNKFRRDGKPFPTLPKMLRHMKEKHLITSARAMDAEQRPKNYFVYYTPEQLQYHVGTSGAVGKSSEPGRFVHYPYGVQPQTAIACTVATPTLAPSRTSSPARQQVPTSNLPQTATYVSNGVNGAVYQVTSTNPSSTPAYVQSYATPTSSQQTYLGHAYSSQPSVSSSAQPSYQQVNGGSAVEGTAYLQQVTPAAVQPHAVTQHPVVEGARAIVQSSSYGAPTPARGAEPVYIAQPGNSVQVKRVVHPEYVMNYYVYYTPEQMQYVANGAPANNGKPNEPGRFVHYPYGVQPQTAMAATAAPGLSSSRAGSPSRSHQLPSSTNLPQATAYVANVPGMNGGVYHQVSTHTSAAPAYVQSYAASTSSQQTYLAHTYSSQPSVSSTVQPPYQPVVNGTTTVDNVAYSQQVTANQLHHQTIDSGRAVVQSPNHVASTSGPVFVAPPVNSVQVKRVLHSEAYVKYIESLYSAKQQKSISKWDNSLMVNHRNTSTNHRKLPYEWVKKISSAVVAAATNGQNGESVANKVINGTPITPMTAKAAKAAAREAKAREKEANASASNGLSSVTSKEEQEVIRSLWRLRNQLLENTTGIQRTASAAIDH